MSGGGIVTVVNLDSFDHTVTSVAKGPDGLPVFDVRVAPARPRPCRASRRWPPATGTSTASSTRACAATLTVEGRGGGVEPERPTFDQPLVVPRTERGADVRLVMRRGAGPHDARRSAHGDVDLRRHLPRPHDPPARRAGHRGDRRQPAARRVPARCRRTSTATTTRPPTTGSRPRSSSGRATSRTYDYPLTVDGRAEPGSFFWYHDHRMDRTARNNWRGLQGMFIVTDPPTPGLRLPERRPRRAADDLRAVVPRRTTSSPTRSPTARGWSGTTAQMAWTGPHAPPDDATVGDTVLVNGRDAPYLGVARHPLPAAAAQLLAVLQLQPDPVRRAPVPPDRHRQRPAAAAPSCAPASCSGRRSAPTCSSTSAGPPASGWCSSPSAATRQHRRRRPRDRGHGVPRRRPRPATPRASRPDFPPPRSSPPCRRRCRRPGPSGSAATTTTAASGRSTGEAFDPARVDHRARLGTVERWRFRNTSDVTHYVHIHAEQWRTLLRDGHAPPPWEQGLEDTWRLEPGEEVEVAARFTDYTGAFMIHCHMLDHEDHGMMARFDVVP